MAKTYTDWGDKAKHTISFAQHKKNVAAQAGGGGGKGGPLPDAARVTARAKKDPAFLARALKNPGLRSRITDINLLPRDLQQERTLNAPIFPGSTKTGRDLSREATAETTATYAGQEADLAAKAKTAQQHQGDVDAWWNQYQAAVTDAAGRIGGAQDQMVGGAQGVAQGVQGLGQAQIGNVLNQAAAASGQAGVPGNAPSASLASEANRAQVARETLAGSYLGQAQQQAAASKGFADYQAGVVAPAYRILGRNETQRGIEAVSAKQSALAVKKGADLLKNRADIRQQEIANTVALGQLTNQTTTAKTTAAANSPAGKAATAALDVDKTNAAKAGVGLKTWQAMTPAQQAKASAVANPKDPNKLDVAITDPKDPFFGLTPAQVARHSQTWRDQRITHAYDLTHPGKAGKGKDGKGPGWVTQEQMGAALTQLTGLKSAATKAKTGQLFEPSKGGQKKPGIGLDRHGAAKKILAFGPIAAKLKDPILVTAALDAVYDGHLSPATIRGLIAAHYQPGRVAKTLGVPTAGQLPKTRVSPGVVGQAGDTAARTVKSVL